MASRFFVNLYIDASSRIFAAMSKKRITSTTVADEIILSRVYQIRDQKVMFDRELAELYGVETRVLKQAVRRNTDRFPDDFMFELTKEEFADWRSQTVMSKEDRQGLRYPPFAFTEQGVAISYSGQYSDYPSVHQTPANGADSSRYLKQAQRTGKQGNEPTQQYSATIRLPTAVCKHPGRAT